MKNEQELLDLIEETRQEYLANVDVWNRLQVQAHNEKISALRDELQAIYTKGAIIPENVAKYMVGGITGMKRAKGVYEIGCSIKVMVVDTIQIQALRSQGATIEEAVANWNAGVYVK